MDVGSIEENQTFKTACNQQFTWKINHPKFIREPNPIVRINDFCKKSPKKDAIPDNSLF